MYQLLDAVGSKLLQDDEQPVLDADGNTALNQVEFAQQSRHHFCNSSSAVP